MLRAMHSHSDPFKLASTYKPIETIGTTPIVTRERYQEIVRLKRKEFVVQYFGSVLEELFKNLKTDAENMRTCRRQVTFSSIPSGFEIDKTAAVLCAYFTDLGFTPVEAARESNKSNVTITLT